MENNIKNVPFNATPQTKRHWEDFVSQTLAGNSLLAIQAYHKYSLAKQNLVKNQDSEMGM